MLIFKGKSTVTIVGTRYRIDLSKAPASWPKGREVGGEPVCYHGKKERRRLRLSFWRRKEWLGITHRNYKRHQPNHSIFSQVLVFSLVREGLVKNVRHRVGVVYVCMLCVCECGFVVSGRRRNQKMNCMLYKILNRTGGILTLEVIPFRQRMKEITTWGSPILPHNPCVSYVLFIDLNFLLLLFNSVISQKTWTDTRSSVPLPKVREEK